MIRRKNIFIYILLLLVSFNAFADFSVKDQKYFDAFTRKKRNINKVKEKHLKKFLPMIGISSEKAEKIYKFIKEKGEINDINILLQIKDITENDVKILKKYFTTFKEDTGFLEDLTIDDILEGVLDEESDKEESELEYTLNKYKDNPLDLNSASAEDLALFPWLTPSMIFNIIAYKGKFSKVEDLLKIEGIDEDIFNKMKPFICVEKISLYLIEGKVKRKRSKLIKGKLDIRIISSYPYSEDYLNKYYLTPIGLKEKLELNAFKYFNSGIVIERDIGEKNINDFQNFYLEYNNDKFFIKKIILGNYKLNFGQGLTITDGGVDKSPAVLNIKNKGKSLKGNLSSYEDKFYQGIAGNIHIKNLDFYSFYSCDYYDGKIEDFDTFGDGVDNTLNDDSDNVYSGYNPDGSGYHRYKTEAEKKDNIKKSLYGVRIKYSFFNAEKKKFLKTGITYYSTKFKYPLMKEYNNDYFFSFRGEKLSQLGFDWDIGFDYINFFGEISSSIHPDVENFSIYKTNDMKYSFGIYSGFLFSSKSFKSAFSFRYYDLNFFSFENHPFSENNNPVGEIGFYIANNIKINKTLKLNFYIDIFKKNWRKYFESMPVFGYESFFNIEKKLENKLVLYFQTKTESKEMNITFNDNTKIYWVDNDWRYRYEIKWNVSSTIRYKMRYENSFTRIKDLNLYYKGYMIFGDLMYNMKNRMKIYFRNIVFDGITDAGIWEYENDIPSYMASYSFAGEGNRFYIMIVNDIIPKKLKFYLKAGATIFFTKNTSSILEEENIDESLIDNTKYDIRLEFIYNF